MSDTWTGTVDGKLETGQPTGVTVNKGDVITIVASGWAERGPGKKFGPQGDTEYKPTGLTSSDALVGALLMKIGDKIYPVNTGLLRWEVPVDGEISFLFNDVPGGYADNTGSFSVKLELHHKPWTGKVDALSEQGTATGITVSAGELITVLASGWANYGAENGPFSPQGNPNHSDTGCLRMQIGAHVEYIRNGVFRWPAPASGEVTFVYHDATGGYHNNTGHFDVTFCKENA